MIFYFAPLEGLSDSIFRRAHAEHFGGVDKYFIPFLTPNQNHCFSGREKRDISPVQNAGLPVVPQLLTNCAAHFLWAAAELHTMGYQEINLNLGCPSATVTAKKKGAGQLDDLFALSAFLDDIFRSAPMPVSIKTRLGVHDPAEFSELLSIFCQYPIAELIIHPRVRDEFYQGQPHLDAFAEAVLQCPFPVCYNGNIFTPDDAKRFIFPDIHAIMLGRGALVNPGLFRELRGQPRLSKEELQTFHERLYTDYRAAFSGERPVLCRMKELWSYLGQLFIGAERFQKSLRKANSLAAYEHTVSTIFQSLPIVQTPDYPTAF